MAWEWTEVKQAGNGSYNVTATEDIDPFRTITFNTHKDRVTPALLVEVLQEKVDKLNAIAIDESNKLQWAINNVDISGVL